MRRIHLSNGRVKVFETTDGSFSYALNTTILVPSAWNFGTKHIERLDVWVLLPDRYRVRLPATELEVDSSYALSGLYNPITAKLCTRQRSRPYSPQVVTLVVQMVLDVVSYEGEQMGIIDAPIPLSPRPR